MSIPEEVYVDPSTHYIVLSREASASIGDKVGSDDFGKIRAVSCALARDGEPDERSIRFRHYHHSRLKTAEDTYIPVTMICETRQGSPGPGSAPFTTAVVDVIPYDEADRHLTSNRGMGRVFKDREQACIHADVEAYLLDYGLEQTTLFDIDRAIQELDESLQEATGKQAERLRNRIARLTVARDDVERRERLEGVEGLLDKIDPDAVSTRDLIEIIKHEIQVAYE